MVRVDDIRTDSSLDLEKVTSEVFRDSDSAEERSEQHPIDPTGSHVKIFPGKLSTSSQVTSPGNFHLPDRFFLSLPGEKTQVTLSDKILHECPRHQTIIYLIEIHGQ